MKDTRARGFTKGRQCAPFIPVRTARSSGKGIADVPRQAVALDDAWHHRVDASGHGVARVLPSGAHVDPVLTLSTFPTWSARAFVFIDRICARTTILTRARITLVDIFVADFASPSVVADAVVITHFDSGVRAGGIHTARSASARAV